MPLNIDFQQILLHLFNFVILGGGLYFLLYKPVRTFMEEREKRISDSLDKAKAQMEEAEAIKADYQKQMADAQAMIKAREQEAEARIEMERRTIEKDAKKQAADYLKTARAEAEKERELMMEEAQKEIRILASEAAEKLAAKKNPTDFDLNDFLDQMRQIKKMGPLQNVLGMLPGIGSKLKDVEVDENALKKPEAIICSMTLKERKNPGILNASRRKRIAAGAGVTVQDVNALIRQFEQMQKMVKQMMGNKRGAMRAMRNMNFR